MNVTLAKTYTDNFFHKIPTTWRVQPKLDGVRAIYKDYKLFTRTGKSINAPDWFMKKMKDTFEDKTVDGELIHKDQLFNSKESANLFQDVVGAVRKKVPDDRWDNISYCAFDMDLRGSEGELLPYHVRLYAIQDALDSIFPCLLPSGRFHGSECKTILSIPTLGYIGTDGPISCDRYWQIDAIENRLESALSYGFEGIMLRDDNSVWCEKRTDRLLKVKPVEDSEATVVEVQEGTGKYKGMTGALICVDKEGRRFKIGTGLTDEERSHSAGYWIDRYITYRFTERTRAGMPRHPSFVCIRDYE